MKYVFLIAIFLLSIGAQAQEGAGLNKTSAEPVEISAENALEWHQKDKQYIARGDVKATQGDVTIFADTLTADYRDDNGGKVEIWRLTAQDNVTIKNTDSTATGDKAVYNVDSAVATLTGGDLKLTTPDQIITAHKSMEYDTNNGRAKAVGNAKIKRGSDTLTAETITANFTKDKNGKQVLSQADAFGNVKIKTPDETITGNKGKYNAKNNTAEITGNVKIIRGPNMLEGARAQVNLTTNISKMFGEPKSGKRVKALFFPGSEDKNMANKESEKEEKSAQ